MAASESEGGVGSLPSGGGSSSDSDNEDGDEGKYFLHKLFGDGGDLRTFHGADEGLERVLSYEINEVGGWGARRAAHSKVVGFLEVEVRSEHGARNKERIN